MVKLHSIAYLAAGFQFYCKVTWLHKVNISACLSVSVCNEHEYKHTPLFLMVYARPMTEKRKQQVWKCHRKFDELPSLFNYWIAYPVLRLMVRGHCWCIRAIQEVRSRCPVGHLNKYFYVICDNTALLVTVHCHFFFIFFKTYKWK